MNNVIVLSGSIDRFCKNKSVYTLLLFLYPYIYFNLLIRLYAFS